MKLIDVIVITGKQTGDKVPLASCYSIIYAIPRLSDDLEKNCICLNVDYNYLKMSYSFN
jgi:hypothetical protein